MNFIKAFLFYLLLALTNNAVALTETQRTVLNNAKTIGGLFGFPETMMAIVLQESSAGIARLGDDGKSLGVAHVTIPAALDVMRACGGVYYKICGWVPPERDKFNLALRMAYDDGFNLVLASVYFKMHYDWFKSRGYSVPWSRAIVAYNAGKYKASELSIDGIRSNEYYKAIKRRLRFVRGL